MFDLKQGNVVLYLLIVIMGMFVYIFYNKSVQANKEAKQATALAEQAREDVQLNYEAMSILQQLNGERMDAIEKSKKETWIKGWHDETF